MSKSYRISDAEWDVMEVVWNEGSATAAEVIEGLTVGRDWSHRTIRTMLSRLVDKGVLKYEVAGNRYVYRPSVTRKRCVRAEGRTFLEKVFDGDLSSLLVHFAQEAKISPAEIEQLKKMLDQKKDQGV